LNKLGRIVLTIKNKIKEMTSAFLRRFRLDLERLQPLGF
jgi:hypothetical protein